MNIGDKVRVIRFGKVGTIVDIEESNNRNIYTVRYNESESEELYEWELELV